MVRSYAVTITGKMPLLMNQDNIEWADKMEAWKNDPSNKKLSKAGDDRTPAHRWLGSLYHNGELVSIPSDNLMRVLMEGGALVPVPGARNNKTFKAQSQSGLLIEGTHWPVLINGQPIQVSPILALEHESSFARHRAAITAAGFALYVKRVRIGQSKHIRVRPMFEAWSSYGVVNVWDEQITLPILQQIATQAGLYKGVGDWRPGGRTPGTFGVFTAAVTQVN